MGLIGFEGGYGFRIWDLGLRVYRVQGVGCIECRDCRFCEFLGSGLGFGVGRV